MLQINNTFEMQLVCDLEKCPRSDERNLRGAQTPFRPESVASGNGISLTQLVSEGLIVL